MEWPVTLYFAFLPDSPSPTAARTLTLVAKSVQNLANLVEFGAKVNIILHIENHLELCFQYTFHTFLCNACKKSVAIFSCRTYEFLFLHFDPAFITR